MLTYASEQRSSVKVQLDKIQNEGVQMSKETAAQFTGIRQELDQAVTALLEIKDRTRLNADEEKVNRSMDICFGLSRLQSMSRSLSRENQILRRLYSNSMNAREDNIPDAERGTFEWIIEEDENKYINSATEDDDGSFHSAEEYGEILVNLAENSINGEANLARRKYRTEEDENKDGSRESHAELDLGFSIQVDREPNQGEKREIKMQKSENTP